MTRLHVLLATFALACCGSIARAEEPPAPGPVVPEGHAIGPVPGPARAAPEPAPPYADPAAARQNGRRHFVAFNCAGCHGDHGGGGMGPSLRDAAWMYGGKPADIHDSIASGRAHGMPSWGKLLPDEYIWELQAYISSLRTPEEPQPPE
jgi:cytochrome c oxidase cbb3-type subunit 3